MKKIHNRHSCYSWFLFFSTTTSLALAGIKTKPEKIKSLGIRGLLFKPLVIRDFAGKIREILDNAPTGTNE